MRYHFLPAVISLTILCFAHLCFPQKNVALAQTPIENIGASPLVAGYYSYISLSVGGSIIDSDRDTASLISRRVNVDRFRALEGRDISYDSGFFIGTAVGFYDSYVRGDMSFAYIDSAINFKRNTDDIRPNIPGDNAGNIRVGYDAFEHLLNFYVHFLDKEGFRWQPYIGFGMGYSVWYFDNPLGRTDVDGAFNAHLTAGINYQLTQKLAVGLFYRITRATNFVGNSEDALRASDNYGELRIGDISLHNIGASIIYGF